MRTICVKCNHHRGPKAGIWYDHHCWCPAVAVDPGICPIEGIKQDIEHPNCRDVNRDGECEHYKAKQPSERTMTENTSVQKWRVKDGRPIHDADCCFWEDKICTCGLLHHINSTWNGREGDYPWWGKEWAQHLNTISKVKRIKRIINE